MQRGVIAGLRREGGAPLHEGLVQTDFRSAPGMAGGPVLDSQGRVVALHAMLMDAQGRDVAALARPIDDLMLGAQALRAGRTRLPSQIGVELGGEEAAGDPAEIDLAAQRDKDWAQWLQAEPGVAVRRVAPGQPAARAGLKSGDRLLRLQGQALPDVADWVRRVARLPAGQPASVEILRAGPAHGPDYRSRVGPARAPAPLSAEAGSLSRIRPPCGAPRRPVTTDSHHAELPATHSSPAGLLGRPGLRLAAALRPWKWAPAPATPLPSCALWALSPGTPPMCSPAAAPRTAAMARTPTACSTTTSSRWS